MDSKLPSLMLEEDQLVHLLPDSFTSEPLTVFFSKMVQSDFAIIFSNNLDQPKYMVLIHCRVNYVVIKLPENGCQVCFSQYRGSKASGSLLPKIESQKIKSYKII